MLREALSLLIANNDAIGQLIPNAADRVVKVENRGSEPDWVEILTCRGA